MYDGVCYPDGSYFHNDLQNKPILCGHSDTGGGQWLLPDSATCTDTSSPIQCTHNDDNGNTIELEKVYLFSTDDELGYTCCLPHSCNNPNNPTDMITANIYCK